VIEPRVLVVRSGANPFLAFGESPRIEIVEMLSHAIERVAVPPEALTGRFDWVVLTSQVAVERVLGDPEISDDFRRIASEARVVAVGAATRRALEAGGCSVQLIARGSGESILDRLPRRMEGNRVLLPCGDDASLEVPEGLRARGASVTRAVVYRKVPKPEDPRLDAEIVQRPFAAFCVTSPSAARWLMSGRSDAALERLKHTPAVALGRFTRRYLESHGVERIDVTEEASFEAARKRLETLALSVESRA